MTDWSPYSFTCQNCGRYTRITREMIAARRDYANLVARTYLERGDPPDERPDAEVAKDFTFCQECITHVPVPGEHPRPPGDDAPQPPRGPYLVAYGVPHMPAGYKQFDTYPEAHAYVVRFIDMWGDRRELAWADIVEEGDPQRLPPDRVIARWRNGARVP